MCIRDRIESINVSHGTNENAELNIQGDEGGTLSVTSTEDAILTTGNINICLLYTSRCV